MKIKFIRDVLNQVGIDFTVRCAECNRDLTHLIDLEVDEVLHEDSPALVFVSMKTVGCSKCESSMYDIVGEREDLKSEYHQLERDNEDLRDEISDLKKEIKKLKG